MNLKEIKNIIICLALLCFTVNAYPQQKTDTTAVAISNQQTE